MRILIATNHLQDIRGSEVVVLEFAREFRARGHDVAVFANWAAPPMGELVAAATGAPVTTDPDAVRPAEYDLAYLQHQVAGLFDYGPSPGAREATAMVFGRLSRRSYLESGGWLHDQLLADRVFANSELTAEQLRRMGVTVPVEVFYNAAPAGFFRAEPPPPGPLQRILAVSNHRDPSLLGALALLSARYAVRHVGRSGEGEAPVTPEMVQAADLLVSIGKSVPYALAGRVPVFVYDHFGGPGYLDETNYALAARFSFTGRCCERRLTAEALAAEIVEGYGRGVAFAQACSEARLARFFLPAHVDSLLATPPSPNAARRERLKRKLANLRASLAAARATAWSDSPQGG